MAKSQKAAKTNRTKAGGRPSARPQATSRRPKAAVGGAAHPSNAGQTKTGANKEAASTSKVAQSGRSRQGVSRVRQSARVAGHGRRPNYRQLAAGHRQTVVVQREAQPPDAASGVKKHRKLRARRRKCSFLSISQSMQNVSRCVSIEALPRQAPDSRSFIPFIGPILNACEAATDAFVTFLSLRNCKGSASAVVRHASGGPGTDT